MVELKLSEMVFGNFYSLNHLNHEEDPILKQHMASIWHPDEEKLILGFEDWARDHSGCDNDFEDIIFFATASPTTAINLENVVVAATFDDSDNDGIRDSADLFPHDPERASVSYSPSQNSHALLCFEDNFPAKGDYDFNDMIVSTKAKEIFNTDNKLKEFTLNMELKAMGASYHNGFCHTNPCA